MLKRNFVSSLLRELARALGVGQRQMLKRNSPRPYSKRRHYFSASFLLHQMLKRNAARSYAKKQGILYKPTQMVPCKMLRS